MTIKELRQSDKDWLAPTDVAGILGCAPYSINVAAKEGALTIPHFMIGTRVKIPRLAFIEWCEKMRLM